VTPSNLKSGGLALRVWYSCQPGEQNARAALFSLFFPLFLPSPHASLVPTPTRRSRSGSGCRFLRPRQ
jgi:hypothetical protein